MFFGYCLELAFGVGFSGQITQNNQVGIGLYMGGSMQIRHPAGDDWWGGPASKRRELLAMVDQWRVQPEVVDNRIGQVSEIVSWDGTNRVGVLVVNGDPSRIPSSGYLLFGRRLIGRVIERQRRTDGQTSQLLLQVASEYCPPVGARIRLG
jgi:hypothetical protein